MVSRVVAGSWHAFRFELSKRATKHRGKKLRDIMVTPNVIYDAEHSLHETCACGAHRSKREHDRALSAALPLNAETLANQSIEAAMVRALFPEIGRAHV